ncbi:MAG: ligase-associated DNA damage response exonuclease [Bacteroidota bacterium]
MDLLKFTKAGIYCPQADVYIDPWRRVKRALITHGHADHARPGMDHYLCTNLAKPVIQFRLGQGAKVESVPYGEPVLINGVRFSFHPAGHIIGSAQIRVEYKGEVWVASGDYKTEDDGLCQAFEPISCHAFITESTFGLPVFKWDAQEKVHQAINDWWRENKEAGKVTILAGYSLGKAQRLIHGLDSSIGTIYTHGAVENINEILRKQGVPLQETQRIKQDIKRDAFTGNIVITPPGSVGSAWMRRFKQQSVGIASGWMNMRGTRRRRSVDRGFVLPDHAYWSGLVEAIKATGASRIFVTHGYTAIFARWLTEQGWDARPVETEYSGEAQELETETTTE